MCAVFIEIHRIFAGIRAGWCGFGRLCGAKGCCPFAMVAGMKRFDATGGASPLPYEK